MGYLGQMIRPWRDGPDRRLYGTVGVVGVASQRRAGRIAVASQSHRADLVPGIRGA